MIREWTFDTSMAVWVDRDTGDEDQPRQPRGTITITLMRPRDDSGAAPVTPAEHPPGT